MLAQNWSVYPVLCDNRCHHLSTTGRLHHNTCSSYYNNVKVFKADSLCQLILSRGATML